MNQMREFTQLPDGGTRFETDSREDFLKMLSSTRKAGGTFDVLVGGARHGGIIRGVDPETFPGSDAPSPAPDPEPVVEETPDAEPVEELAVDDATPEAPAEDADGSLGEDLLGDTPPPPADKPRKGHKR